MSEYFETSVGKFTFKVAADRDYTAEGVWALADGNLVRIGLSDYAQQRSGDIAFVDVKPVGTVLSVGDEVAAIETIKVNLGVASPVSGSIARVNPALAAAPETINQDPYGAGWLCEIQVADGNAGRSRLLDAKAYFEQMKQAAESEA